MGEAPFANLGDADKRADVFAVLLRQSLQGSDALGLLSAFDDHELDALRQRFVPFSQLVQPFVDAHSPTSTVLARQVREAPFVNLGDANERTDLFAVLLGGDDNPVDLHAEVLQVPMQEFQIHSQSFKALIDAHALV
jgi:hypothetical protein